MQNSSEEIWKPVVGYEGLYEISNLGILKSLISNKNISPQNNGRGYMKATLCNKGKMKQIYIHRIVLLAFVGKDDCKTQVNHKNGIKHDNRLDNLEWMDESEQMQHAIHVIGTVKRGIRCDRSKIVYQYTLDGEFVDAHGGTRELARLGYKQASISKCCLGEYGQHKGFIWSYKPLH